MDTSDEFEIKVADVVAALLRRRGLIITLTAAFFMGAVVLAFVLPKTYRIESVLVAVSGQQASVADSVLGQLGGLGGLAGMLVDTGASTEEESIAFLQSRSLTRDFIAERNLLPVLFPKKFVNGSADANADDAPTIWEGVREFEENIRKLERDRVSGLLKFAIEWQDAEVAREWSEALVAEANARLRARAIREAESNIAFLEEELSKTTIVELRTSIYDLMESQINAVMLAEARPDYAFRIVDPAMVPDPEDFVRPRRLVIIFLGAVFGFMLAAAMAFYLERRSLLSRGSR